MFEPVLCLDIIKKKRKKKTKQNNIYIIDFKALPDEKKKHLILSLPHYCSWRHGHV